MRTSIARSTSTLVLWAMALGAGPGCKEEGHGSAPADTDGATDDGTSDGDGDDSGGIGSMCEDGPGRVGLQRLTRAEYNRTVRDLFGITSAPADAFPPDSATSGFDNNADSLTVSPQLAALLFDAAEAVAAEAMANDDGTILLCDPDGDDACAREILAALALRVYRRPATTTELDGLFGFVELAAEEGDAAEVGIENALQAMLMAPQFLYRSIPAEGAGPLAPGEIAALDGYALATRLAYFLWGSTPDDELLARAGEGTLGDPDGLRAEFDRMLADPKSEALFDGFFSQWLQLGKLGAATPDPVAFPEWDEGLRADMLTEARLFFAGIRERDDSVLALVSSNRTYANADLAALYGVAGVEGSTLVEIETDPAERAGVLTMPAVLAMTSGPFEPNIVKRGVWLAEAILCASPPPPPDGVPPAPDPEPGETERERLARHREDPSCASCHDLIDPLGFGLEHYDSIGRWRDDANGEPVDDLGELPGGRTFQGAVELAALLAEGDEFRECVTMKTMTYALGRAVGADDACVVSAIAEATVQPDATFSDFLWAVVTSDAFRTEEAP